MARDSNDWLLQDAIGSIRATVDTAGVVSAETAFTAFGEPLAGNTDSFGFAGEQLDTTGLLHLRARQYNPGLGRFTTVDPVQPGAPGTTGYNLYTYAANNPTTFTDPTGQAVFVEYVQTHQIEVLAVAGVAAIGFQQFLLENSAIIEEQIEDLFDDITENLQDVALTGEDIIRQNDQRRDRDEEEITDPFPPIVVDPTSDVCHSVGVADEPIFDGISPPYDLFSLGRLGIQPHPRTDGRDVELDDDGSLCANPRKDGQLAGLSSFAELSDLRLSGQVWKLPANSPLGPLDVIADGRNYGGPFSASHHTIFTSRRLSGAEIQSTYTSLPWIPLGHTRDLR